MRTSPPGRPGERGFSLLEIVLVVGLVALVAVVVLPSFSRGLQGVYLETSARDLLSHMKSARSEAISRQRVVRVILQAGEDGSSWYSITNEFGEEIRRIDLPHEVVFDRGVGDRESFPMQISFYANGRSSGGRIELRNPGGRRMTVRVDPLTGLARVLTGGEEQTPR